MLYPQNGDRIVAVDSVTSLHSMYKMCACQKVLQLAVKKSTHFRALAYCYR